MDADEIADRYKNYVNHNLATQQFRIALLPRRGADDQTRVTAKFYWGHKNSRDVQREMYKPPYKDGKKLIMLKPDCRTNYLQNLT